MVHSTRTRARPWRIGAALIMVVFVLGAATPSYGDQGNGNDDDASSSSDSNAGGNSDAGGDNGQGADNGQGSDNGNAAWKQDDTSGDSGSGTADTGGSSGDANEADVPQPPSNADKNEGGANGQCPGGPYCSTDGDESLNGNGKGKAVGKPCAGCVGKADNKNPQGQKPDWAHDGNNGYECDGNNGIGKTNPAHTGCAAVVPPPPPGPPPTPPIVPPAPEQPEAPPVAPEQPEAPPEVAPTEGERPRPPVVVAPEQVTGVVAPVAAPTQGILPPTGMGALEESLALAGAGMLLTGAVFLVRRRRPEPTHRAGTP